MRVSFGGVVIVNGSRDDCPLIAASSAEIMTLLGM